MSAQTPIWPRLDYAADKPTIETLHLLLQLIGKLPLRLHPWVNHGWHAALLMTPRGAITHGLPGARHFAVELDFLDGAIRIECDTGSHSALPVCGKTIAQVHGELSALLSKLGLRAPLQGAPNEIADPIRFSEDHRPREWNRDAARRLHGAFLNADRHFAAFRSLYRGKSSPSHLFWGSFDLAVTRFSGRPAPPHPGGIPNLPDTVTREAYSHEVISAGFWPGSDLFEEAAFYAYAYPTPPGLGEFEAAPATWNGTLGEFLLPYETVRRAADPEAMVRRFLQTTYEAAATRLDWPQGLVISDTPSFGHPPA